MSEKVHLSLRIDKEVRDDLKIISVIEGKSMKDIVESLIIEYIKKNKK
jgi:hypothetical protein